MTDESVRTERMDWGSPRCEAHDHIKEHLVKLLTVNTDRFWMSGVFYNQCPNFFGLKLVKPTILYDDVYCMFPEIVSAIHLHLLTLSTGLIRANLLRDVRRCGRTLLGQYHHQLCLHFMAPVLGATTPLALSIHHRDAEYFLPCWCRLLTPHCCLWHQET